MVKELEIFDLSKDEQVILAHKLKISPVYLWQYGAGIRIPRLAVVEKMMKYEPRLTVTSLMAPRHRRTAKQKRLNKTK